MDKARGAEDDILAKGLHHLTETPAFLVSPGLLGLLGLISNNIHPL